MKISEKILCSRYSPQSTKRCFFVNLKKGDIFKLYPLDEVIVQYVDRDQTTFELCGFTLYKQITTLGAFLSIAQAALIVRK